MIFGELGGEIAIGAIFDVGALLQYVVRVMYLTCGMSIVFLLWLDVSWFI